MTIDRSLKRKGRLARSRNVLTRDERILQMQVEEKWVEGRSPLGIPKTRVIKLTLGKKKKVKAEGDEAEKKGPEKKGAAAPKAAAPAAGATAGAAKKGK